MYIDTSTVTICVSGDECNDDEPEAALMVHMPDFSMCHYLS